MAIALEARIEFKQLCDTLEDVAKTHDVKKKEQILQAFIDTCRNVGDKLKIEYSESYSDNLVQDIDLVILGGYYGEGKYTGIIKSFMMGVVAPANKERENPSQFFSIVSVSTGIGDEMLRHLQTKLAPYWIKERPENIVGPKRNQPDMWIHPEHSIILTIRATEMVRSNEYPIGYSLRFPRVTNVRMDKPWYSPCTTLELLSLTKDEGMIQKLTKREATLHDLDRVPVSKLQKIASRRKSIEHNVYNKHIVPLTRLLDGKEICVINGTDELSKEQIEEILQQHSARIVQNPINTTFCVIVGNNRTIRGKEVVNSGKYDVVTLDWVERVTNINRSDWTSLIDFLPWELLCSRDITRRQITENYDEYYDSFVVDADEESLKRSFGKIAKPIIFELMDNPFISEQEKEMNKELFGSTIKDNIDSSVTHVFVEDNETSAIMRDMKAYKQISTKIVKCKWIEECFRNGRIFHFFQVYHPDANDKFLVTNDLREICNQLRNPKIKLKEHSIQIFSHFKPMLLGRCNIENIDKLFRNNDLYYVQTKYDGERSQLHMKNGKFKYLTRRGYDITNKYGYGETGSLGMMTTNTPS
ncbi:PREDICTED: DNA ligase 4 [Atta cephalotes]|uniref:DNA ligase IV n=1 Tax=Atta cephalotes TaxID=12957 RepID=A0A158NWG2_ATTCE|nr:PREDICTED: DNA ligase 4 [Atta cephalotes]